MKKLSMIYIIGLIAILVLPGCGGGSPGPSHKHIVFVSDRAGGDKDIFIMQTNGAEQTNLTDNDYYDDAPCLSPNGKQIVFVSNRDGDNEIYKMDIDGTHIIQLTVNDGVWDGQPKWSPNGAKIVFTSQRDGNYEVYVMNADGSGQTNLSNNALLGKDMDMTPAWSPDGAKIAFASSRGGNFDIWVMDSDDGGNVTDITLGQGYSEDQPDWYGTKIVFKSNRPDAGDWDIYIMNDNGTAQTLLVTNTNDDSSPKWAEDGARVYFSYVTGGFSELYQVLPDGNSPDSVIDTGGAYNNYSY